MGVLASASRAPLVASRRKTKLSPFVLAGLALLATFLAAPKPVLAADPVAALSFDEGKGNVAQDSASSHDATRSGATWTSEGKYGAAFQFDGTDDYLSIPDSNELDFTDGFTLEAWVRPEVSKTWSPVIAKETSNYYSYRLSAAGATAGVPEGFIADAAWSYEDVEAEGPLPTNTWSHLAFTYDGDAIRLYVDGQLEEEDEGVPNAQVGTGVLKIGAYKTNDYFKGRIDEVRLYDEALSEAEIEDDQETGIGLPGQAPPPDPVAALSFDEGKGNVAQDSANGHDATRSGATWTAEGKYGAAFQFDGVDDYLSIPDSNELDFTDGFTLEAWVRPEVSKTWSPVIAKETSNYYSYRLSAGGATAGIPEGRISDAAWSWEEAVAEKALPTNTWSHLAFTYDGKNIRLYVNGALEEVDNAPNAQVGTGVLKIGSYKTSDYFKGRIDEVRLYDEALGSAAIEDDQGTAIGLPPPPLAPETVAALSFDEGTGNIAYDYAHHHDATRSGASWTTEGKYGSALQFDGTDDYLSIPDSNELDFTDGFTLEAWVRPEVSKTWSPVIAKETSNYYSYRLSAGGATAGIPEGRISDAAWSWEEAVAEKALPTNTWSHLAFTYDGKNIRLYVNGALEEVDNAPNAQVGTGVLKIGSYKTSDYFKGRIDEVRLYDEALGSAAIEDDQGTAIGTPLNTTLLSGPSGKVFPDVSFTFSATQSGSNFECSLDGAIYGACASPKAYQALAEGSHTFRVRAVDALGNPDSTPAERTFQVVRPPETTITSSQPSYASGATTPIAFTSDEPGSTYKCTWNGTLITPCTSPFMPAWYEDKWNTFGVTATDSEGNSDPTPATYVFHRSIYPPAPSTSKLASPDEGAKSGSHLTLRSEWGTAPEGGGVSSVAYQLKHPSWDVFKGIPSEYLRDSEGDEPGWALPVGANPGTSEPLFFDLKAYAEAEKWAPQVEGVKLRALFNGGVIAAGASEPVTVTYSRFAGGPGDATTRVGPATVDLLTGSFTMTRTDVSIPVPGYDSNLEFTRTYNSAYGAHEATNSKVLGSMWQPSAPVEAEYEEQAWQKVLVQHRPAVPPKYNDECIQEWEEFEQEFPKDECLEEYAIPEANWVEVLDNEGAGIAFDKVGSNYVAPDYAREYILTKPSANFVLIDSNGTRTAFTQNGGSNEYQPSTISFQGTPKDARLVYEIVDGQRRLKMIIAPSAPGVTCNDDFGGPNWAPETPGCRSLVFEYAWGVGDCELNRLWFISYYSAKGSLDVSFPAVYTYDEQCRLKSAYDGRIWPPLKEEYAYDSGAPHSKLTKLTPPGEEPWNFDYYAAGSGGDYEAKLKSVSRASLLGSPSVATTTIAYDVPISGEDAPYEMSPSALAQWGQGDYPVDATAIFPPDQVPSTPPSDYTRATVSYMDPDGHLVNTASAAPPGVEGEAITTSETDEHGNVVRSLSAQARLDALMAENPVTRSKELDSHSTYNADGTRMLESWGPLHEVRLESGETVQARAHTQVEYDKGATEPQADEAWPNLPTKETVGAAIPGQEGDKDVRVTETEYNWNLRKPTATIVDPGGLNLRTTTVYDESTGLVVESRQPSDTEGKNAGTTVSYYYSAGSQSPASECRNKPKWANLPCASTPRTDPSSEGGGNPKLPWTITTGYNSLDLPTETQERVGSPSGEIKRTTTATYDQAGRPLQSHQIGEGVEVPPSETLYEEDTGRPYAQRFVCAECDSEEVRTTFDTLGRPVEYEDADGNVSEVGYDLLGRPAITYDGKGTQTATYDPDSGVLTQMTDSAAGTFAATYDADGRMLAGGLPNGLVAQASYDPSGTPTDLAYEQTYCSEDCTWLQFERETSIHGQVLLQESAIEGALSSQAYTYDKAGRLTLAKDTEAGQCTTRAYSFDKNTNRTKLITRAPKEGGACDTESAGTKQEYSYDKADRLIGEGVEYDYLGRITDLPGKYAGGGDLETSYYTSDLTHTQTQDGITNTYELDATGRQRERIRVKGEEESTEIYHYAGGSDGPAWIDLGESWTRSIPGIGGNLGAIYESATEDVVFQLSDMHGDIVATADDDIEATELLSVQGFDEYGNPKEGNPKGELTPKFGWLGAKARRTELPSGVVQMGVRSYVPALGRFVTRDPVFGGSANAYEYANGDPVNQFDLTGEKCEGNRDWVKRCKAKKDAAYKRDRRRVDRANKRGRLSINTTENGLKALLRKPLLLERLVKKVNHWKVEDLRKLRRTAAAAPPPEVTNESMCDSADRVNDVLGATSFAAGVTPGGQGLAVAIGIPGIGLTIVTRIAC